MKKKNIKNKIILIIAIIFFGWLYIYSATNICTFIFGKERELYVKLDNHLIGEHGSNYYIWYNNGKKMVKETVHLSLIEAIQWKKNSGYITFKQLGTNLTHRSAFVYSLIYFIIVTIILTFYLIGCINKYKIKKLDSKKTTNNNQMSLNI